MKGTVKTILNDPFLRGVSTIHTGDMFNNVEDMAIFSNL